jgi:transposase
MNQPARKRYTTEFKAQAVELLDTGKPISQVAEELCISNNLLYKWRQDALAARAGSAGPQPSGQHSAAEEMRILRREMTLLKQENDILKKAAIILGTRPQPNSGK